MRQKVFSILALLCLMVSGAWADPQEELLTTVTATGQTTYTQTVESIVTVTPDVSDYSASGGWNYKGSVNVEPFSDEYTITRCVFKNPYESLEDDFAPFIVTMWDNTASVETKNGVVSKDMGIKTIEVYGYKNSAPAPAEPIVVEWNNPSGSGDSFTQDGVTFTCSSADWYEKIFLGPGTFTTDLGNFTKIEVYVLEGCYFEGTGWVGDLNQKTWTGNAASVSWGDDEAMIYGRNGGVRFVFTIEPAAASEPDPEPATPTPTLLTTINSSENAGFHSLSKTFDDIAVVTFSRFLENYGDENGWFLDEENATISVTAVEGYTITSCKFYCDEGNAEDTQAPFEAKLYGMSGDFDEVPPHTEVNGNSIGSYGVTKIEVYGYQNSASEPEPQPAEPIVVTWNNLNGGTQYTQDGVTFTCSDYDDEYKYFDGPGTFTTDLGNFTKIEITAYDMSINGEGWSGSSVQKTWTGNAASVPFNGDIMVNWSAVTFKFTIEPAAAPAGQNYDLTLADGSDAHGTVTFSVGGAAATQAKKGDVVTVTVTPENGYSTKEASVRAYTSWGAANASRRAPGVVGEVAVTKNETDGTWSFTMPEANVWVVVTYAKNVQDAWIQDIADQTWTGEAITPTVTVMDGETTLVLNTDYTVGYENNTNTGTATVTVTGMGDYSGTATKTFTIVADKTALNDAIAGAEAYHFAIIEDHPAAAAELLTALIAANDVRENPNASQDEVNDALSALTTAMTTAQQAVLAETKTALNNAIAEGQVYYAAIVGSNPDAANDLLDAIAYAQGVLYNTDATQEQVENALSALTTAISNIVAATRVTITIPAKSYVARIDADKRQIENAVAGVSLFSVKNVTNTEVVLTDELSVIAAEMPYFIYNDNDTEVEVSIIVSSEDADNVDYDSEHFKGTLVDKTFTDEDMEEADHYVLSNGHDFVWVKDAGVLAAGKCWIQLEKSPNNARALSIVFEGETTGISTVKTAADTKDAAVYDLQGRRVMQPTKGLFIVNGKKVVIK